jgi:hypothetical protein
LLFYENSLPPPLTKKGLNETTSSNSSSSHRRSLTADEREKERERERERGDFVKNKE